MVAIQQIGMPFTKMKIKYFILIMLIMISSVNAEVYGTGNYGLGVFGEEILSCGDGTCNNGENCATCPSDCGICPTSSTSGGGGGSCNYDWQCTEWFPYECPESEIQERICSNKGTCNGIKDIPEQTRKCTYEGFKEPLFDIFLKINEEKVICANNKLNLNIKLENYGKIELLDAFMTYWIIDENNKLIVEQKDTRSIQDKKEFDISLDIPEIKEGTYRVYAQITYDSNKTAVAGKSFEISSKEECSKLSTKKINWNYIIFTLIVLAIVLIIIKIIKNKPSEKISKTQKYKEKIKENLNKIKSKKFVYFTIIAFMIMGIISNKNKITGLVIDNSLIEKTSIKLIYLLIALLAIFLIIKYKSILLDKIRKKNKNSIKDLEGRKVYTEEGNYLGKVEEVIIENNRIDSLRIKLNKKIKEIKGIVISYREVKNASEIIIVNNEIIKNLTK
jgi:sporulation protein YlmC with PRC-barrel domain